MTGVTAWAGQLLIRGAGEESRTRLLLLTMGLVALLTALISVNGAVAALLPVVVVIAVRLKRNLVATADAAGLCRTCRLDARLDRHAGERAGFGRCEPTRASAASASSNSRWSACRCWRAPWRSSSCSETRLLPERNGATMPADFSRHAKTLVEQYGLATGIYQMRVRASSPYVGKPPSADRSCRAIRIAARRDPGRGNRGTAAQSRSSAKAIT